MSYTILTTYFFNLNNFEKIIKRQSLRKNLLHKVHNFVLNYKFRNLNENYFDNKILQDKLLYIYHKLNMKCPCHRSLILKSIKKLLVKLRYLFNILKKNILQFYKEYFTNFYHMKALVGKYVIL